MANATTPLPPGSMTVPPLFGWELILTGLVVLVVVAVAFLMISATGTGRDERSDWKAWLDARSGGREDPVVDPPGPPVQRAETHRAAEQTRGN
ncbi:hypothetical protein [Blastococcus sp. CT_GayMR16]|uniref:hypothetical protein n=1 Tax=Blastococcus sp. CT_GayMR16 TaxID=2559607 RepID=UPI001073E9B9|nr:hypothetical protein [Blastococcus sp. CT_GayMR16]TFV87012.1 hypothetical protein E4P38_15350 [Blastococcus sp. CT_GayMR16]